MLVNDFKEKAFGTLSVDKIQAKHGFKADKMELIKPLEAGKMRFFCTACGIYHTFSKEAVLELIEFVPDFPEDYQKHFLQTESCSACDSSRKKVEMKKISEL